MTAKPNTNPVYVCLMSYQGPQGLHRQGERLRSDHPAVKATPTFWVEDGLDDQEMLAALRERFPGYPGKPR